MLPLRYAFKSCEQLTAVQTLPAAFTLRGDRPVQQIYDGMYSERKTDSRTATAVEEAGLFQADGAF